MSAPAVFRGAEPLIVSIPHAGVEIPPDVEENLVSLWLARQDADWWVDRLYDFADELGATVIRTPVSRTVIDVNRDPSGKSLYPGQATTELCPTTTFDGELLYRDGRAPDPSEIARRRELWFEPYHRAIGEEIARLRNRHASVVLFDAHSIRPRVPRLFDGVLPDLNFGTNSGVSCAPALTESLETIADRSDYSRVTNGRFKGGYITRHHGRPDKGVHAIQLELSTRTYLGEQPAKLAPDNWPPQMTRNGAAALRELLTRLLRACIDFAHKDAS
ncbi:MAG TPA: N-formylglutamate deformylase [Rhizomicrobium sp.]|jgi:N-formylglutamate deformylase|nr:N-formylglutamate deformylase [Rhizomicrobium sp.]